MKFISFAVVITFNGVIVCWCCFKEFPHMWLGKSNISLHRIEGSVWVRAMLMVLNEESLNVTHVTISPLQHFIITPFHHSKYTCFRVVWVRAMLILLNDFGLITYVLTYKRWIRGLHNSSTNNTLITSIYLGCVDTLKTNLYFYPRFLLMCMCVPISVDIRIRRIKKLGRNR